MRKKFECPRPEELKGLPRRAFIRTLHAMQEGWYIKGEASSANRLRLVEYNLSANIIANLIGGNFYTGFLLVLGANDSFIGLMSMLIFSANLLQLFSPFLLERFERRKPLLITMRACMHIINIIFIGLIPFLPGDGRTRLIIMGACVFAVNALNAFMAPGFSVWHIAHIPGDTRVSYFSLVAMLNGIAVAVVNLAAAKVVDIFKTAQMELYGLEALRVLALLIAFADIWILTRIREMPRVEPIKKIHPRDLLTKPWKERVYLRTILVVFLWSLIANMPGSYYTVYLLRDVGISYSFITLISFFNVPVLLLLTPVWRRVYIRHSWLKPLSVCLLMYFPHYILLALVQRGFVFLYPIGTIWAFVCAAGINLAFSSVAYINIPKESQTLFIGFYSTISNLGALLGVTLGREFVTRMEGVRLSFLGMTFGEKQLLLVIVGALMLVVSTAVRAVWRKNTQAGVEA